MKCRLISLVIAVPLVAAGACGGASSTPPAPVAPEPSATSTTAADPEARATARRPRDIVQPVRFEKQEVAPPSSGLGDANGVEGMADGDFGGVVAAPPPPPPPPPPPRNVSPAAVDALRIAGDKAILPDDDTRAEFASSGKDKLVGSYRLCLTTEGNVSSVGQLKRTGFPAYDDKIRATIRAEWRFQPFLVSGVPTAACTAVTFIYAR
jgi:protein TonB